MEIHVLACVTQFPSKSTWQIAMEVRESQHTVVRILKKHKYSQYKLSVSQSLNPVDLNNSLKFC